MLMRNVNNRSMPLRLVTIATAMLVTLAPAGPFTRTAAGGQGEGIKVHGDWTIVIREPDGRVVSRRDFRNALDSGTPKGGALMLVKLLNGAVTLLEWAVVLQNLSDFGQQSPCTTSQGGPSSCAVVTTGFPGSGLVDSSAITRSLLKSEQGSPTGFVLTGTATAMRNGSIATVATRAHQTSAGISGFFSFTSATLQQPIAVAAGQIIQVKVVISFS